MPDPGSVMVSRACALMALVLPCLALTGCLDLLARALMDPSSLAKEAASSVASQTARSLVSPTDVGSLSTIERSVNGLDQVISDTQDNGADLTALRGHLEEKRQNNDSGLLNPAASPMPGVLGVNQGGSHNRRLGEPGLDPALVHFQDLRNRDLINPSASRKTSFAAQQPNDPNERLRSRDPWRFTMPNQNGLPDPVIADFTYDLDNGAPMPTTRIDNNSQVYGMQPARMP